MNSVDAYIEEVLLHLPLARAERQRIEADLRTHIDEALAAGETPAEVLEKMGSPGEVAAAFIAQTGLHYASFARRLAAFLIDLLIILLPLPILGGIALLASNSMPPHPTVALDFVVGGVLIAIMFSAAMAGMGLFLLYFPLMEGRFGATIGKRWLRLRVVKESGEPAGYREAFLRRLSFYLDIFPLRRAVRSLHPEEAARI